jgi:hypothetical protein
MVEPNIRLTINSAGLDKWPALCYDSDQLASYVQDLGAEGLEWLPQYCRLYKEVEQRAAGDDPLPPALGATSLITSLEQPFAASVWTARSRDRKRTDLVQPKRLKLMGTDLAYRAVMPPVTNSRDFLRRAAWVAGSSGIFINVYPEELRLGEHYDEDDLHAQPITRITVEQTEKLGVGEIGALPKAVGLRGVSGFSFDTFHATRPSRDTGRPAPEWSSYLPALAKAGMIRQFAVRLNARGSLSQAVDSAKHLAQDNVSPGSLGPLGDQLQCVVENLPEGAPLDITVTGNLHGMRRQLPTVFHNLAQLAGVERNN